MKLFFGVCRYEFLMSIRRIGLLATTLLLIAFFIFGVITTDSGLDMGDWSWTAAGNIVFSQAIFFPVVVGIFAADRAKRDYKLGVMELLRVTEMRSSTYVLGKYFGVSFSMLALSLVLTLVLGGSTLFFGAGLDFLLRCLAASLVINAPAIFFVTAFSLACPLFMPVRVYQILFTGYWYWGNFLNPEFFPSISHTLLNASGRLALEGIFHFSWGQISATTLDAILNILILGLMSAGALIAMNLILRRRQAAI